jgi:hypothetical protein
MVGSHRLFGVFAGGVLAVLGHAQSRAAVPSAPKKISVELNKLEPVGRGCRAYVMIYNPTDSTYSVLKLDLVLFRPDGVIDRRIVIDIGPLRANKKDVKTLDLEATPCSQI